MEEIFQALEYNMGGALHKAYFDNGRYYYNFPESWFNTPTQNKAVALRRISTTAKPYNFTIYFTIERKPDGATDYNVEKIIRKIIHIRPTDDMDQAMSILTLAMNRSIQDAFRTEVDKEYMVQSYYTYDGDVLEIHWKLDDTLLENKYEFRIRWLMPTMFHFGFYQLLNQPLADPSGYAPYPVGYDLTVSTGLLDAKWTFQNVWNRTNLFIHASFVTYTSYGYLGRGNEFYTKPSKIYAFNDPHQFFFEVSFDGIHKTILRYENFIVELALILDSRRYQSE
jgi:hypothetical protein